MRGLIYCRKSTDRDDKQANSLEHQLNNCRNTINTLGFILVREIMESVSAKEEYKRAGFNEMVELCKRKQVDFIIIDEPKRLSRNNIDTSRIIDLMDKNLIQGIYATSRQYLSSNSRDKFLLQLDLSLSKMDNEDRASDVRNKMITCAKKGRCLGKAPFGYRNITLQKGHKSVSIEKYEAKIVNHIFQLRKDGYACREIIKKVNSLYEDIRPLSTSSVYLILQNRFYIGKIHFAGEEYNGIHEPIISKMLFEEVQRKTKGIYTSIPNSEEKFPLKGYLRDESGLLMNGNQTKGYTYYKSQSRSNEKVNISESKLLEALGEIIKEYDNKWLTFTKISNGIIREIIKQKLEDKEGQVSLIRKDISILEGKSSSLLDMKLDEQINKELFEKKNSEIIQEINKLKAREEKIQSVKIEKIQVIQEKMVELSGSLYRSYNSMNNLGKSNLLKNMMVELSIGHKKELTLAENKLFGFLKSVKLQDGGAWLRKSEPHLGVRRVSHTFRNGYKNLHYFIFLTFLVSYKLVFL